MQHSLPIMLHLDFERAKREMVFLPLGLLNGWLFGIDSSRVKPGIRAAIERYQRECYDVLYRYWHEGEAQNPRKAEIVKRNKSDVNGRAWALAQANYETYRSMMYAGIPLDDPASAALIAEWTPPDMLPATSVDQAIATLQQARKGALH